VTKVPDTVKVVIFLTMANLATREGRAGLEAMLIMRELSMRPSLMGLQVHGLLELTEGVEVKEALAGRVQREVKALTAALVEMEPTAYAHKEDPATAATGMMAVPEVEEVQEVRVGKAVVVVMAVRSM
jgi:hypothetical protein